MFMRAVAMSLAQPQPSTAPPPITTSDRDRLEEVTLTTQIIKRLEKKEYNDCPVCQEEFKSMIGDTVLRLPCDHLFCVACINQWLSTSRTCPVCRLEMIDVDKKYDEVRKPKSLLAVTPPMTPVSGVPRGIPQPSTENNSYPNRHANLGTIIGARSGVENESVTSVSAPAQPTPPHQLSPARLRSPRDAPSPFRQVGVGSRRATSPQYSDGDFHSESEEEEPTSTAQQALLQEILQRRDVQQQRALAPPARAPRIANANVPVAPAPPARSKSKAPTATLTVGRPRATAQNTVANANGPTNGQQRSGVGVRGLLNRNRQS